MRYLISTAFLIFFLFISLISPENLSYGFNSAFYFLNSTINYISSKEFHYVIYELYEEDLGRLYIGYIFFLTSSIILIILAIACGFYKEDDVSKKIKKSLSTILILVGVLSLFSGMLNKQEYDKIKKGNTYKEELKINFESESLIRFEGQSLYIEGVQNNKSYDKRLEIKEDDFDLTLLKIKGTDLSIYKKELIYKYKYKIEILNENKTRFKGNDAIVLEYKKGKKLYIDYIILDNDSVFVISFKFDINRNGKFSLVKEYLTKYVYI